MDCFLLSISVFTQSGRDGSEEPTVVQLGQGKEEPSFPSVDVGSVKPVCSSSSQAVKALEPDCSVQICTTQP